jgi:hypothetical protein
MKATKPTTDRTELEAQQSAARHGWTGTIITTPAGPCRFKVGDLTEMSTNDREDRVHTWENQVINFGHSEGVHYAPAALRYWLRQEFDVTTSDGLRNYNIACTHIDQRISSDKQLMIPRPRTMEINTSKTYDGLCDVCQENKAIVFFGGTRRVCSKCYMAGAADGGVTKSHNTTKTPETQEPPKPLKPQTIGKIATNLLKGR